MINVGEIASKAVVVQPVSHYECRRDFETDVIGTHIVSQRFRLEQHSGEFHARRTFLPDFIEQIDGRITRVNDIFHNDDVPSGNIVVETHHISHFAAAFSAVVGAHPDEADFTGAVDVAQKVSHEDHRTVQYTDKQWPFARIVAVNDSAHFGHPGLYLIGRDEGSEDFIVYLNVCHSGCEGTKKAPCQCKHLYPFDRCFASISVYFCPMQFHFSGESFRLGILGGGQLGRMLIQEAINLNISTSVMDPDASAPCRHLCESFTHGDFRSEEDVYRFGKDCSLVTVEIEHVNIRGLERLEAEGIPVYPQPQLLRMVQDKGLQKEFYAGHGIPTAGFVLVEDKAALKEMTGHLPGMLKLRKGGYDGKGVMKIRSEADTDHAFDAPCVLEELVDFVAEIAVLVSRNAAGQIAHFPAVEMEFNPQANLVEFLCSPARIADEVQEKAIAIARQLIDKMGLVGLLAVEMFVTADGEVLVNEIAPRPHNSGHHTIEGNVVSQYAQHLRAILGLPPGDTSIVRPAVMVNLLGEPGQSGAAHYKGLNEVLSWPGVYVHLYGKKVTKPFRKMGHVTVTAANLQDAIERAREVQKMLKVVAG